MGVVNIDQMIKEQYEGDPMLAILDIASRHSIAIAFISYGLFAATVNAARGTPLTEGEQAALKEAIGREPMSLDAWLTDSRYPAMAEYMAHVLNSVGVTPPAGREKWVAE